MGVGGQAEAPTRTRAIFPPLTEPRTLPDRCKQEGEEAKSPWGPGLGVHRVWGPEQGDVKTPALASAPICVGATPASTGARGSLVGTPGTHSLALSTPLQTPRISSEIHPQRGEALGMARECAMCPCRSLCPGRGWHPLGLEGPSEAGSGGGAGSPAALAWDCQDPRPGIGTRRDRKRRPRSQRGISILMCQWTPNVDTSLEGEHSRIGSHQLAPVLTVSSIEC